MALTTLAVLRDDLRDFNREMLTYSASKGKRLNSWDFFTVVLKTYKESGKHGR